MILAGFVAILSILFSGPIIISDSCYVKARRNVPLGEIRELDHERKPGDIKYFS